MTYVSLSPTSGNAGACYRRGCTTQNSNIRRTIPKLVATPARSPCMVKATGSAAQSASDESDGQSIEHARSVSSTQFDARQSVSQEPSQSIMQRIKQFFGGDKVDMQRLKALGLGAVASYGCVSNVTYGTGLSISWITFVRRTGEHCRLIPYCTHLHCVHMRVPQAKCMQHVLP